MGIPKVLIVDDNKEIQIITREYLEFEGFAVQVASNGVEALNLLAQGDVPDLILLDLMMPKMDGVEFMVKRKSDSKISVIPVILLSALAEVANVNSDGCVQKPFVMATLSKAISEVFEKAKSA